MSPNRCCDFVARRRVARLWFSRHFGISQIRFTRVVALVRAFFQTFVLSCLSTATVTMAPPTTSKAGPTSKEQDMSSKEIDSDKGDEMPGENTKKRENEATTSFPNADSTNADTRHQSQAKRHKTSDGSEDDDDEETENGKQRAKVDEEKSGDGYSESQPPVAADSVNLLTGEVESLMRSGLEAYQRWEEAAREAKSLKDEIALKNKEIESLRASEESSRATIQVRARRDFLRCLLTIISTTHKSHESILNC